MTGEGLMGLGGLGGWGGRCGNGWGAAVPPSRRIGSAPASEINYSGLIPSPPTCLSRSQAMCLCQAQKGWPRTPAVPLLSLQDGAFYTR